MLYSMHLQDYTAKTICLAVNVGFSLEHPQRVGIVGIVGTVGIGGIVGIKFCHPKPRPTTPSILVDI